MIDSKWIYHFLGYKLNNDIKIFSESMIKSYFVLNLLMKDKAYYDNKDRISNNKFKKSLGK